MERDFVLPSSINKAHAFEWGPPIGSPDSINFTVGGLEDYPFEPVTGKQERLGRVCDFTYATFQRYQRDGRTSGLPNDDETDFKLVDSRPLKANKMQNRYFRKQMNNKRNLQQNSQQQQHQQQQQQQHQQQHQMQQQLNQANRGGVSLNQAQNNRQYQQHAQRQIQWQRTNRQRQLAEWSIEPQQDWTLIDSKPLTLLPRVDINSSQIKYEDLHWCGELRSFDRNVDRVLRKNPLPLMDTFANDLSFYWPGSADDELLVNIFDTNSNITVAATDQILACLMSASQSRISWHLIFNKFNGRLFIDKNNGTSVDLVTVDETSKEPPLLDDPVRINRPAELSVEALKINQNFSQQVLNRKSACVKSYPYPAFVDPKDKPASKLYRYRLITLPGQPHGPTPFSREPITLITRGEIDAVVPGTTDSYITIRAFNEYNLFRSGRSWKAQLESQKGALIAQETKNNHCKVGKWVAQALIAGCEYLKIGFVTRVAHDNNNRHTILNIQTYKTKELGAQTGLQEDAAWGIVRGIVDFIMSQPDGRYTLVKDPVKSEVKLYRTSFEVPKVDVVEPTAPLVYEEIPSITETTLINDGIKIENETVENNKQVDNEA